MGFLLIEMEKRKTIADRAILEGIALHSGKEVKLKVAPAPPGTGIIFKRIDLADQPEIEVNPGQVVAARRCTALGLINNGQAEIKVSTVEHLMSAIWAFEIDDLYLELSGAETPVGDGSALIFYNLFKEIGIVEQPGKKFIYQVDEPLYVRKGNAYLTILPDDKFRVSYTLDYDHPVIGTSFFEFTEDDNFIETVGRARTFGFAREVEKLHSRGLALGGNLDNAVLVGDHKTVNELRYPDEFVRHKVLDLIGDMALNGQIKGHLLAVRSGHSLHVELASKISEKIMQEVNFNE